MRLRTAAVSRLFGQRDLLSSFRHRTKPLLRCSTPSDKLPTRYFGTGRDATREVMNFLDRELEEASIAVDDRNLNEMLDRDGWRMSSEHGKVTLSKTQGKEAIRVEIKAHFVPVTTAQADEEGEEASGETPEVELLPGMEEQEDYFNVVVAKRNLSGSEVVFECCANRGFVEIDQILWKGAGGNPHVVKINEIEEPGQEAFYDFLEERGIDNNFTKIVFLALDTYDQNEFRSWLRGLKEFVKKDYEREISSFIKALIRLHRPGVSIEQLLQACLDLSTQSVKAIVINETFQIVGEQSVLFSSLTSYPTQDGVVIGPNGRVTSPVLMWVAALDELFSRLKKSNVNLGHVKAISASGQQHGSVYWRKGARTTLQSFNPEKSLEEQLGRSFSRSHCPIWMDTSTSAICTELNNLVGGKEAMAHLTGSRAYERFTINQIVKFARDEPQSFAETEQISLVSSFVASLLTGHYVGIDTADASGMNCMDILKKDWVDKILGAVEDPQKLREKLGKVVDASSTAGTVSPYFVKRYGLSSQCSIIASSGDNPCSLAGLRLNVGEVAVSLGTSDTLFGPLRNPHPSVDGHVMANAIDADAYMCMIVFSNGSLTRQAIRDRFASGSWEEFSKILKNTSAGNGRYVGLFYLTPEITPSVGEGTHRFDPAGSRIESFPDATMNVRAVVEAQFLAMLLHSKSLGVKITERIIATGGASKNPEILQILSDVFGVPVSIFDVPNSAALGAAYRAVHGHRKQSSPGISFFDAVHLQRDYHLTLQPNIGNHEHYKKILPNFQSLEARVVADSK